MEYIVHLNDLSYINKIKNLGIQHFVVGCHDFSYRQSLSLSYDEIKEVKQEVQNCNVYVLVNAFIDEKMIKGLEDHLEQLNQCNVDGIFFQDFAVVQLCKEKNYPFKLFYTPDTLNTNYETLNFLSTFNVHGTSLAREISLEEKKEIQNNVHCKVIVQGHGVEYMASSKRNLLKNYFDKNNMKLCTSYHNKLSVKASGVDDACYIYEDQYATHIVSKKQLCSLDVLDQMIDFDYLFLESLYLSGSEYFSVVEAYQKGLQFVDDSSALEKHYKQFVGDNEEAYYHSFLFDETVYKIKDVRIREGKEVE